VTEQKLTRLSREDLVAESGSALPAKEVLSLLNLNLDLDLALDLAAPIDLAVAANANVAAPITAAVSANVLSALSHAAGLAHQDAVIDQHITGDAIAHAPQTSHIDQAQPAPVPAPVTTTALDATDPASVLGTDLLHVDADLAIDADLAAPVAGAVALNANVAAPIDASVAANVASVGSTATAIADQSAVVVQHLDGVTADATAAQDSTILQ
jgi:hypothetical protein